MTIARQVLSVKTYHIVRQTNERMFMLKPSQVTLEIVAYCIFEAALKYGVLVHGFGLMSNHLHMQVTDQLAKLPLFTKHVFTEIAKAMNAHWGHTGSFWARAARPYPQLLVTREAIVQNLAYILANPVTAGLVDTSADWPGLIAAANDVVTKKVYFGKTGLSAYLAKRKEPELKLSISLPPGVGEAQAFADDVYRAQLAMEAAAREERKAKGTTVLGAKAARAVQWYHRPKTPVTLGEMNPAIMAVTKEARIAAIAHLKAWRKAYREALKAYCDGNREAVFPIGTWRMHQLFDCKVAQAA
jgi:putative transposase